VLQRVFLFGGLECPGFGSRSGAEIIAQLFFAGLEILKDGPQFFQESQNLPYAQNVIHSLA
jgi:hypothetical protein